MLNNFLLKFSSFSNFKFPIFFKFHIFYKIFHSIEEILGENFIEQKEFEEILEENFIEQKDF